MLTSLPPADAVKLLLTTIGTATGADRAQATELAAELEWSHPALRQAGAYISHTPGVDLPRYLHLLRTVPEDAPDPGSRRRSDADRAVARVWALTSARIEHTDPLAIRVLRVLACYAPDDLPRAVLNGLDDAGETALTDALELLSSYGVVDLSPDGPEVSVHRQVQAAVVDGLTEDEHTADRALAATLLRAALPPEPEHPSSWSTYARLLAHALAVLPPESPAIGSIVDYLHANGDHHTAHPLQYRRHAVMHDTLGPEHADTLTARVNLASLTGEMGNVIEARDRFTVLAPLTERILGPEHPTTLDARANLASWTGEAGDPIEARDRFTVLAPLTERALGPEHLTTLSVQMSLAHWTGNAGNAPGARDRFATLAPLVEQVLGSGHPYTLGVQTSLARWTGETGNAAAARDRFAWLAAAAKDALGPESRTTLNIQRGLARWMGETGDTAGARDHLTPLVPLAERILGPEHPVTLNIRNDLAICVGETGDAIGARDQFTTLVPLLKRVLGPEHPDTLTARAWLAVWMSEAGDAADGMDQLAALVPMIERVLGSEHPITLIVRVHLADLTGETGNSVDARNRFAVLVPVIERVLGPEHPVTSTARVNFTYWKKHARRSLLTRWIPGR
ncbi:tetratricopeptide repeat protein [Streptosporangium sp. NPDC023825]|uniref:tetratricopeptide repeat protein n=1 Tax=Streptosporangium sp. NPDC023825 TaxID=3154909 RepID=UPI003428838A